MLDLSKRLLIVLIMGFCIACMFFSVNIVNAEENSSTIEVNAKITVWPANGEALIKETSSIAYYYLMNYELTSGYGWRRDPLSGQTRMHKGIDLSKEGYSDLGDPVLAVKDGVIEEIEKNHRGAGYTVLIQHVDKTWSKYAHLKRGSTDELEVGQNVLAGDIIGQLGNTGRSTGPHLHLELTDESGNLVDGYAELHRLSEPVMMAIKVQEEFEKKKKEVQIAALEEMFKGETTLWNIATKSNQHLTSSVIVSSHANESSEETNVQYSGNEKEGILIEVKKNMTLWELSQDYGLTIQSIKDSNGLTSDTIIIGQELTLYPDQKKVYIVSSGDTLPQIASEVGVSVETIKELNDMSGSIVFPNQILQIK